MSDPIPDLGRFAEPSLYILMSLSDGPKHGYAIMTDVEAISGSPLGPRDAVRGTGSARAARADRGPRAGGAPSAVPADRSGRLDAAERSWSTCRGSRGPRSIDWDGLGHDPRRGPTLIGATPHVARASPGRGGVARSLAARSTRACPGCRGGTLLRRGAAAGVAVWLAEIIGGTLAFAWTAIGSGAPTVRVGTLADLIASNPGIPIRDGFPAYVPEARAFIVLVDPGRGGWRRRRRFDRRRRRRSTSAPSRSAARTLAAARTRASRTTGSTARATSRGTTASGSRRQANGTGRPRGRWTASRSRWTSMAS